MNYFDKFMVEQKAAVLSSFIKKSRLKTCCRIYAEGGFVNVCVTFFMRRIFHLLVGTLNFEKYFDI